MTIYTIVFLIKLCLGVRRERDGKALKIKKEVKGNVNNPADIILISKEALSSAHLDPACRILLYKETFGSCF
jgi:hypothetical protein